MALTEQVAELTQSLEQISVELRATKERAELAAQAITASCQHESLIRTPMNAVMRMTDCCSTRHSAQTQRDFA